jgi:hypothetical protein
MMGPIFSGDGFRVQERYIELLAQKAAESNRSVVGACSHSPHHAVNVHRSLTQASVRTGLTIVTPYLSTGGTDTRAYLNLTRAIYRFAGIKDSHGRISTVDERLHVVS